MLVRFALAFALALFAVFGLTSYVIFLVAFIFRFRKYFADHPFYVLVEHLALADCFSLLIILLADVPLVLVRHVKCCVRRSLISHCTLV